MFCLAFYIETHDKVASTDDDDDILESVNIIYQTHISFTVSFIILCIQ